VDEAAVDTAIRIFGEALAAADRPETAEALTGG
jgi:hypothetical protein